MSGGDTNTLYRKLEKCRVENMHQFRGVLVWSYEAIGRNLPYILESNPHPFYSFRGLKIRCGLESRAD